MSAKRAMKRKAGDTPPVSVVSGKGHRGVSTSGRGAENFVPVGVIARQPNSMMHELFLAYDGTIETVLHDKKGQGLFALIRGADKELKAQFSSKLRDRLRRLVHVGRADETKDLESAFRRLEEMPVNAGSLVYSGELDTAGRVNVALILNGLDFGLAGSLRELRRLDAKVAKSELKAKAEKKKRKNLRAELGRRINDAIDAALGNTLSPTKRKSDSPMFSLPWGIFGEPQRMHPSVAFLIHARRFAERKKRLPTKREIREELEEAYKADLARWASQNEKEEIAESTWSDIYKQAGLAGLMKESGSATSAKKGRKR